MSWEPVGIVGLGLIGGSLARDLASCGVSVRGWSLSPDDRAAAAAAGVPIPNGADGMAELASACRVIVLAVPVQQLASVAEQLLPQTPAGAVLLHAGSVQRRSALGLSNEAWARVIGSHPVAGSHEAGFSASRLGLFRGATVSIESRAGASTRQAAEWLWEMAGARVMYREAEEHDRIMMWVSQIPQLASTALAGALAGAGISPGDSGPGARDATRLAATPLSLWADILLSAPPEMDDALRTLEHRLAKLREAIQHRDRDALAALWEPARAWRRDAEQGR